MAVVCARCGEKQGVLAVFTADLGGADFTCDKCKEQQAQAVAKAQRVREDQVRFASRQVIVTTTHHVDGYRVKRYLGIESVEFVIGTGLFSELTSEVADFFGQRSTAFEKKLQQAKTVAMDGLKYVAADRGANAVIGVDMDYTEFSGNRVALILNGTLVELERRDPAPVPEGSLSLEAPPPPAPDEAVPESIRRVEGFVSWACRRCGARSRAPVGYAGRVGKCAGCQAPTLIPS